MIIKITSFFYFRVCEKKKGREEQNQLFQWGLSSFINAWCVVVIRKASSNSKSKWKRHDFQF